MSQQSDSAERLLVCRCEEITLEQVEAAMAAGCRSVDEIKKVTRAGMGFCQGRVCRQIVQTVLENHGIDVAAGPAPRYRMPVRPVPLGQVASAPDQAGWPQDALYAEDLFDPAEMGVVKRGSGL